MRNLLFRGAAASAAALSLFIVQPAHSVYDPANTSRTIENGGG